MRGSALSGWLHAVMLETHAEGRSLRRDGLNMIIILNVFGGIFTVDAPPKPTMLTC